jgi:hypothetical protein
LVDIAVTPLFDALELCLRLVFLLVEAFRFVVPLKPLASPFAVVAVFLRYLLALVTAVLCLEREVVELGFKCRQALVTFLERSAECLTCLHPFLERRPFLRLARKMEQVVSFSHMSSPGAMLTEQCVYK